MPHRQTDDDAGDRSEGACVIDACLTPLAILDRRLYLEHANPAFCALFDIELPQNGNLHVADHAPEFEYDDRLLDGLEAAVSRDEPVIDYPLMLINKRSYLGEVRIYARRIERNTNPRFRLLVEARAAAGDVLPASAGRQVAARTNGGDGVAVDSSVSEEDDSGHCRPEGRDFIGCTAGERRVLDIAMEEQRRFGRELQDNMLQSFAGIQLLIAELREEYEPGTVNDGLVAWLSQSTAEAGRRTSVLASDAVLAGGSGAFFDNFATAVRRLGELYGIAVEVDENSDGQPRDAWIEANLARIVRSAALRAIRNGGPDPVRISTGDDGAFFTVEIRDSSSHRRRSENADERVTLGIMACHAELCGATLRVERGRSAGTTVIVSVPLRTAHAA